MGLTLANSRWLTPTPQPIDAPTASEAIPVSAGALSEKAITHLTVYDTDLNVSLASDGVTSLINDFALAPGRYAFLTDPENIYIQGVGARYQVGYEVGLADFYLGYWPVFREWQDTTESSIDLDTSLCVNGDSVYVTAMMVKGSGNLYVTLDGRDASASDYDIVMSDTGFYRPVDALIVNVAPDKIQVYSDDAVNLKLKYGYFEYPAQENGVYNTPILGRTPFPV